MFSNLQSFFNYIGGKSESSNNSIKSILTKKGIQFSEIQSGINVNFNDTYDKIIDIFFDNNIPLLNENTKNILLNSDIIIFSCGTQFSSLIPTYKTLFFKETIEKSNASKFLILNCDYDNDIINYTGDELLDKINEYLPLQKINIIISNNMNVKLIPISTNYNYINIPLLIKNNMHDGNLIWKHILKYHFDIYYNLNYIFNYDYTLFNKDFITISNENLNLLQQLKNKIIITNNCFSNLLPITDITIYSNIGNIINNKYIINKQYILNKIDIDFINQIIYKIDIHKKYHVQNRKNISISIKPVEDRDKIIPIIQYYLSDTEYKIIKTGHFTLEFMKKELNKRNIFVTENLLDEDYTYISDLNDIEYTLNDKIKYLQVNNIITTNLFIKSIIMNKKMNGIKHI